MKKDLTQQRREEIIEAANVVLRLVAFMPRAWWILPENSA